MFRPHNAPSLNTSLIYIILQHIIYRSITHYPVKSATLACSSPYINHSHADYKFQAHLGNFKKDFIASRSSILIADSQHQYITPPPLAQIDTSQYHILILVFSNKHVILLILFFRVVYRRNRELEK
jgi:hypothetical protein